MEVSFIKMYKMFFFYFCFSQCDVAKSWDQIIFMGFIDAVGKEFINKYTRIMSVAARDTG